MSSNRWEVTEAYKAYICYTKSTKMLLKRLEIAGFKSFARKAELDFASPITAIVGPNGSGKSNVAESFRFVLGEQSIKSMRGKKTEDLIFNGTPQMGRLNRASVKLVFDNTSKFLPVDFSEVSFERVIHRDGVSEYFLNGSSCRLKDITELLANANIGSSGHHIISQGEADRILNAPSPERKEMIEDALGLKVFQTKKEESMRKLEKTFENLEKVQSLRREIAPHIRFLKQQVEKVEKAKAMREELKGIYSEYLMREDAYLRAEQKQLGDKRTAPKQELGDLEKEIAHVRKELSSGDKHSVISDEIAACERNLNEVRRARNEASHEIGMTEGEIRSLSRIAEEARRKQEREDSRTVPLREVKELIQKFGSNSDSYGTMDALKGFVSSIIDSLKSLAQRYEGEVADASATDFSKEIAELEAKKTKLQASLAEYEKEEEKLRATLDEVRRRLDEAKEGTRDAEKRMVSIVARQNELHTMLAMIDREAERLSIEETEFKRELTEAAVLVGRDVISFYDNGQPQSFEAEERTAQLERRKTVERLKIRLETLGGGAGEDVVREFNETTERDAFLAREITDLESSAENLRTLITDLEQQIATRFKDGLAKINDQFSRLFAIMFGGGSAALSSVQERKRRRSAADESAEEMLEGESEQETQEGVDITVDVPRKRIKSLAMLSGGERALTSIALLFAMSQVNPPPFVILDETDAALDEANSRRYGDMIESLADKSQLILITHNRETMSRAGVIYGVTMGGDGVSKLLSIKFNEAVAVAK
jgi:chromosome segregation ATPase